MSDERAYLTVKDVAVELGVSVETVRRWLRGGELAGYYLSDKSGWRIKRGDLDSFLVARYRPGGHVAVEESPQES